MSTKFSSTNFSNSESLSSFIVSIPSSNKFQSKSFKNSSGDGSIIEFSSVKCSTISLVEVSATSTTSFSILTFFVDFAGALVFAALLGFLTVFFGLLSFFS